MTRIIDKEKVEFVFENESVYVCIRDGKLSIEADCGVLIEMKAANNCNIIIKR